MWQPNQAQEQADVYIINFANQQGYVVTSADRRVPGVLAYNSYGHLGDTLTNPGQAILFSYMQDYIEQERENFEKNKEALKIQAEEMIFKQLPKEKQEELIAQGYFDKEGKRIITKGGHQKVMFCINDDAGDINPKNDGGYEEEYTTYGEWQTKYVKAPLLKTLWGQSGDYNDMVSLYCPNDIIPDQAPVGCVATAVGQLMAYHKKPAVFKGRTIHWDEMTRIDAGDMFSSIYSNSVSNNLTAKEDIQHLLARLGDSDLLNMDYKCGGSSSNIDKAVNTLNSLGYKDVYGISYDGQQVVSEIKNNRPVYIDGCSYKIPYTYTTGWWFWKKSHTGYTYQKCHAWVLDGYVLKTREVKHYTKCPNMPGFTHIGENRLELVHNNFGWGDSYIGKYGLELDGSRAVNTGWYHIGIFDTQGKKEASSVYKSGTERNYQFLLKIITNIY